MQNNLPCTDKTMRFGVHNFDFSSPILLENYSQIYINKVCRKSAVADFVMRQQSSAY